MRFEVVAAAALLMLAAGSAAADETPARSPRLSAATHHLAADRLTEASVALVAAEVEPLAAVDRLAAMQLRFVTDSWLRRGAIPRGARSSASAADAGDEPADWHASLAQARTWLIEGDYERAETRLSALTTSAPDGPWASAASTLAELAHEVRETHGAARGASASAEVATVVVERPLATTMDASGRAAENRDVQPGADTPPPRKHWYGWETLMSDGISIVTAPIIIGIGGYFLATPITHAVHRRPLFGLLSLGIRIAAPLTGAVLGAAVNKNSNSNNDGAPIIGALAGVATAIFIDAKVLAYEPVKEKAAPSEAAPRGVSFLPMASPRSEGGFDVGVGGRF